MKKKYKENEKEYKDIKEGIINIIKCYPWNLINSSKPIEKILEMSDGKLEHHDELIIMWLKLSELMYMADN